MTYFWDLVNKETNTFILVHVMLDFQIIVEKHCFAPWS